MTNSETESHKQHDTEQAAEAEKLEQSRKKIVAACFFLFFIVLWLIIHYFAGALTSAANTETEGNRFRVVEIPPGGSVSDIARKLAEEGIIFNRAVFRIAATIRRSTRNLKAGEYMFNTPISPIEVLRQLEEGRIMLHEFTIPEGYTAKQISKRLHKLGLADGEEFLAFVEDAAFCKELGIDGSTLEGFLFPDTYRMARGLPTKTVLHMMVDRFQAVCSKEIQDKFSFGDPELRDIVIIASIIEKEAIYDMEKPLIASVIYNRLKRKMPLQCDVTIRYPLDNYGIHLTYADLAMDSPYNSYIYSGLPPTPISSPGLSAIRAALNPPQTDYLYFVSMNNGHHKFSSSLAEHNKAVHKYQILNERG